jgi:hypothetical protein
LNKIIAYLFRFLTNFPFKPFTAMNYGGLKNVEFLIFKIIFTLIFSFKFAATSSPAAISHANLLKGYLPVLETIDESQTLDFVKHSILKVGKGKPLTPIRENGSTISPSKIDKEVVVETHGENCTTDASSILAEPVTTHTAHAEKIVTAPKMDISVMEAINKRRKSYNVIKAVALESPAKILGTLKSQTPKKDVTLALKEGEEVPVTRGNKMAFLQAINARRKSYNSNTIPVMPEAISVEKLLSVAKKVIIGMIVIYHRNIQKFSFYQCKCNVFTNTCMYQSEINIFYL